MTHIETLTPGQFKLILEALQNAQIALESICDFVYASDAPQPYSPLSATDAEDIHLEAAGMLVPLETAIVALHACTSPSKDRLDLATKTVAE